MPSRIVQPGNGLCCCKIDRSSSVPALDTLDTLGKVVRPSTSVFAHDSLNKGVFAELYSWIKHAIAETLGTQAKRGIQALVYGCTTFQTDVEYQECR